MKPARHAKKPTGPVGFFAFQQLSCPLADKVAAVRRRLEKKTQKNFHVEFNTTSKTVVLYS
jgi:hypothetical protein